MAREAPLDQDTLARARAVAAALGEREAPARLGASPGALARACTGWPVRAATAEVIRARLDAAELIAKVRQR